MTASITDKNSGLIAKRWAKSLMELACENSEILKDDILNDLKSVIEVISSSEELSSALNNPAVSVEEKQIILCKLFQNKVMPLVYNFLHVLNLRKRTGLLPQITEEFEKELDKIKNIVHVSITSAIDLTDERKEDIKNKISGKLNKNIATDWNTNSEIIAGLVFNIDEVIVDNSVRCKLEDLSKKIIKG